MSPALAAGLQIALVVAALALVHVPLGDYLARIFTSRARPRAPAPPAHRSRRRLPVPIMTTPNCRW
jgi:hypothetical protein